MEGAYLIAKVTRLTGIVAEIYYREVHLDSASTHSHDRYVMQHYRKLYIVY